MVVECRHLLALRIWLPRVLVLLGLVPSVGFDFIRL